MTRGRDERPAPERNGQVVLASVVAVLCLIGLVMVLSASSVQALRDTGSSWFYFRRQVLWLACGTVALLVGARVDYRALRRAGLPLLALSVALLVVVLVPGVGIAVGGSTRWLGSGSFRMQPSELAKLGLLLFGADLLARRGARPETARAAMVTVVICFSLVAGLVMIQPDLGTTLVIGCLVLCLLHASGTPLSSVARLLAVGTAVVFLLGIVEPYRRERLLSFLNPWADAGNTGYQVVQSLVGLGTGRYTGVGVGASRAKWGFLPNAHTDFIFSIIGEELGMVGSLVVLGLFAALAVIGVRVAMRAPDRYGMLLAAGITAWITSQAFINIGAVVGVLPVSGLPLPFVSFGGTSLVLLMGAVGVLLNIAGQGATRRPGSAIPDVSERATRRRPAQAAR
ncbi:MAG TPA: putative lipid II flippase FtsW [Acidimicrobiales bacterium]|nr:putative lipid II flippase FtsW [Acidimicrobiales bacterium]